MSTYYYKSIYNKALMVEKPTIIGYMFDFNKFYIILYITARQLAQVHN